MVYFCENIMENCKLIPHAFPVKVNQSVAIDEPNTIIFNGAEDYELERLALLNPNIESFTKMEIKVDSPFLLSDESIVHIPILALENYYSPRHEHVFFINPRMTFDSFKKNRDFYFRLFKDNENFCYFLTLNNDEISNYLIKNGYPARNVEHAFNSPAFTFLPDKSMSEEELLLFLYTDCKIIRIVDNF